MKRTQNFAVIQPGIRGFVIIMLMLPLASIATIVLLHSISPSNVPVGKITLICLPSLLIPVLGWLLFRRNHVQLDADTLTITAGLHKLKVPRKALDMEAARILNLDTQKEVQIGIKTFGTAFPGYYAGHFRQKGGGKIFALLTDKTRVLMLPERDGRLLLLSLERPRKLLDALSA